MDAADQEKIEASKNELHNLLDKPQLQGIPVSCCLDRSSPAARGPQAGGCQGLQRGACILQSRFREGIPFLGGIPFPAALLQELGQ